MAQLFDWLRTTSMHPLIKSCVFHYEFEFIPPVLGWKWPDGAIMAFADSAALETDFPLAAD